MKKRQKFFWQQQNETGEKRISFWCWWRIVRCNTTRRYRESEERSWKWRFAWCLSSFSWLWLLSQFTDHCGSGTFICLCLFVSTMLINTWYMYMKEGHLNLVKFLVEKGATVQHEDGRPGETALSIALIVCLLSTEFFQTRISPRNCFESEWSSWDRRISVGERRQHRSFGRAWSDSPLGCCLCTDCIVFLLLFFSLLPFLVLAAAQFFFLLFFSSRNIQ